MEELYPNKYVKFELKAGDILYRTSGLYSDNGEKSKYAHVEFCAKDGGGESFVWGEVHSNYIDDDKSKRLDINYTDRLCITSKDSRGNFVKEVKKGIFNENDQYDQGMAYTVLIRENVEGY